MSLVPHRARGAFFLEKWYLDTLLFDGSVLIVYLARIRLLGGWIARVTADFFGSDGSVCSGSAIADEIEGGADWLHFGPARISGDRLDFDTDSIRGSLRFSARAPSVTLLDPFVRVGSSKLCWTVEVPDADVTGELRLAGSNKSVAGRGYRDRVWFDIAPWRFPLRELHWGRAFAGEHAVTWVSARTADGHVEARWADGRVDHGDAPPPVLEHSRVLLEKRVADLEGLRLGPLRPALRRITGDPYEVKWAAEAVIGGVRGRAIHEVAKWRSWP